MRSSTDEIRYLMDPLLILTLTCSGKVHILLPHPTLQSAYNYQQSGVVVGCSLRVRWGREFESKLGLNTRWLNIRKIQSSS